MQMKHDHYCKVLDLLHLSYMRMAIPVTLETRINMAAYAMQHGLIDAVIVGADRITTKGDVANKIGTYGVAVLAKFHNIPFYVAAPYSTFDFTLENGSDIPIEMRDDYEVTSLHGVQIAPNGIDVLNPAFDVTPHELVTAIITEEGVLKPNYEESIDKLRQIVDLNNKQIQLGYYQIFYFNYINSYQ